MRGSGSASADAAGDEANVAARDGAAGARPGARAPQARSGPAHADAAAAEDWDLDAALREEEALHAELELERERAGAGTADAQERCEHCSRARLDKRMLADFGERVCYECRTADARKPGFATLSKTEAKDRFLLSDAQVDALRCRRLRNPRQPTWGDVRLYLVKHLERAALETWGSLAALAAERERRAAARVVRSRRALASRERKLAEDEPRARAGDVIRAEIKRAREAAFGADARAASAPVLPPPPPPAPASSLAVDRQHKHTFAPETLNPATGVVESKCTRCGMPREVEEL